MDSSIINNYQNHAAKAQAEVQRYSKQINTYSFMRLGVFALVVVAIAVSLKIGGGSLLIALCILLLLAFVWLVSRQSVFEEKRRYFIALKKVNDNELESLSTRGGFYNNGDAYKDDAHPYTADLDIFGSKSLFHLLNRTATVAGLEKLAGWLHSPSSRADILTRQEAVKELAAKPDWKLDMQARLQLATEIKPGNFDSLFAYLKATSAIPGQNALRIYLKLCPFLLAGAVTGAIFYAPLTVAAILLGLVNWGLGMAYGAHIQKAGFIANKMGQSLQHYAGLFKTIEDEDWQSVGCKALAARLQNSETSKQIDELGKIINRMNYSLIMIVGFILNVFFLWAIKQTLTLEDWKRTNRSNIEDAFTVLGEFEALLSVAGLHINYPEWCFPAIAEGKGYTYITTDLAHPLINPNNRVSNSYQLVDDRKIDIITGSNMAGKSTFLRTLGINAVLGLCGAPVCAREMTVSVVRLVSYMRIKDSLSESTSTFKAELDRLQMLLGAVQHQENVFFLIDEMLRGTNSADKYLGSKAVIEHLIAKRGVGLVATHDLQISELEQQYPDYIRNFYFDIEVSEGEMLFDYKLKPGACKTFNASLLLKRIGIDVGSKGNAIGEV